MKFSMLSILLLIQLMVIYRATKGTETAGSINSQQRSLVNTILVGLGLLAVMSS